MHFDFRDIVYIKTVNGLTWLRFPDALCLLEEPATALLEALPPELFVRVHPAYIISLRFLDKVGWRRVWVAGQQVPLASPFRKSLLQAHKSRLRFPR